MITMQDWSAAKTFSTAVEWAGGKLPIEVSDEVYLSFMNTLPPAGLGKTRHDFSELPIPVQEYFLVGEPTDEDDDGRFRYMTFARAYDTRYFYLGLFPTLN